MIVEKKKKWHSLAFHKNTNCWTLSENRYDRGRHLQKFYTKDCKCPKQAGAEVIQKVRHFLGSDLVTLKIYSFRATASLLLVQTIHFSGAGNESTL